MLVPSGRHDEAIGRILMEGSGQASHFGGDAGRDGTELNHGGGSGQSQPRLSILIDHQAPLGDEKRGLPKANVCQKGALVGWVRIKSHAPWFG